MNESDATDPDFEASIRRLAEEARAQAPEAFDAATAEDLVAYLDGDLSAEQVERLQHHLALSPESSRALVDLTALQRMDEPPAGALNEESLPSWDSMRALLAEEPLPVETPVAPLEIPTMTRRAKSQPNSATSLASRPADSEPRQLAIYRWALAACLPLLLGAGIWIAVLHQHREAPRINLHRVSLSPLGQERLRDLQVGPSVTVPRESSHILLQLNIDDPRAHRDYQVKIFAATDLDRPIWQSDGFAPDVYGTFNLELPRDFLAAGRYRLRLFGGEPGASEQLAEYAIRVAPDPP